MFTTGSKLLFGASALSLATALVYAWSTEGALSSAGTLGLLSLFVIFALLGGVNYANRDCNVSSMDEAAVDTAAAAQRPGASSVWPAVVALGIAGLVVGAVSKPAVFKVAVVVLLAGLVEWMVLGWSERAGGDAAFNADTRRRMLHPLEFPVLGALALGAIVYAFSRLMLRLDKDQGRIAFGVVAALVLAGAFLFAGKRKPSKRAVLGISTVAAIALLGAGVASALQGQRSIDEHPTTRTDTEVCLQVGADEEIDADATQSVSATSNLVANIYLKADGSLVAYVSGYPDEARAQLTVPRRAQVNLLFHNESDEAQRLTARTGEGEDESLVCTAAVEEGDQAFLSFQAVRGGVLLVPGLVGGEIELLVP